MSKTLLSSAKALLIILFVGISILVLYIFLAPFALTIFGYYPDAPGWVAARAIIENKGTASDCHKIIHTFPNIFSPTVGEQRANCIHEYAAIAKDPNACELLLPHDYGWDCLGRVKSKLYSGYGCGSTNDSITCNYESTPNLGITNCNVYSDPIRKDWCRIERTATLPGVYECDLLTLDEELGRDECQHRYAYKLREAKECASIKDEKRRTLCELEVKYAR